MRYQIVAEAYRDLEAATARLALIDRLASLVRQTPTELLPTVALLCQVRRTGGVSLTPDSSMKHSQALRVWPFA